jgi:hypothetical protein
VLWFSAGDDRVVRTIDPRKIAKSVNSVLSDLLTRFTQPNSKAHFFTVQTCFQNSIASISAIAEKL